MTKNYIDYTNKVMVSIPDQFINVHTGETDRVSKAIEDQINYHTKNNTLSHLLFTALSYYVQNNHKPTTNNSSNHILTELHEIKTMLREGHFDSSKIQKKHLSSQGDALDMKELEDVLEAFGG